MHCVMVIHDAIAGRVHHKNVSCAARITTASRKVRAEQPERGLTASEAARGIAAAQTVERDTLCKQILCIETVCPTDAQFHQLGWW